MGGCGDLNNNFIKRSKTVKMSNLSSEYDYNFSEDESAGGVAAGKYIKKLKTCGKKGHKMISTTLKRKRC